MALVIGLVCVLAGMQARAQDSGFAMSPAQFWASSWANGPRLPAAGDVDGDGYADLLNFGLPGDGIVDFVRTSPLGKFSLGSQARHDFGRTAIAIACARFTLQQAADFVAICDDGQIRLATDMPPGTNVFNKAFIVGSLPANYHPATPARAIVADFNGDQAPDILLIGADGRLLLLQNEKTNEPPGRKFIAAPVDGDLPSKTAEVGGGVVTADHRARVFWIGSDNTLYRAAIQPGAGGKLQRTRGFPVTKVEPGAKLAIGRFQGKPLADVLIGRDLLPGGDPRLRRTMENLPSVERMKGDKNWIVADFDGNGKDDLLRQRSAGERFFGEDIFIHFSSDRNDSSKGFVSTAQDGLLDDWKTGKVKPGGLDLAALGCKVGRRDVIVEIGSFDNVDQNWMRSGMEAAVNLFANLPVTNPDGSRGIALHLIYHPPVPVSQKDRIMQDFDGHYPPKEHRGITHYFWAERDGPLVAQILGGNGHFNGEWIHFAHEFGHNLGLVHEGFWNGPAFCPIYRSLMNYTYNGSLFPVENLCYSDGRLKDFPLDERHLSERLPLPMEQVAYLSQSPYYFRLKPGDNPNETLVDWNWNGVFGETDVAADINYKPGSNLPGIIALGKTAGAPAVATLVTDKVERPLLAYPITTGPAKNGERTVTLNNPGRLLLRWWQGNDVEADRDKWSEPVVVEREGVTGEASCCTLGEQCWIAYPTTEGIKLRAVSFHDGKIEVGEANVLTRSSRTYPTLTLLNQQPVILLWRDTHLPLGVRTLIFNGTFCRALDEIPLPVYSAGPVGAAGGTTSEGTPCLFVSTIEDRDPAHRTWMALNTLVEAKPGKFTVYNREWCGGRDGGKYAPRRNILLHEPFKGMEATGRFYLLAGGTGDASQHFVAMNIADRTIDVDWSLGGGWLTRQSHGGTVRSRSAPGACLFRGDILLAQRLQEGDPNQDDTLRVTFHGNGIEPAAMGDFDDISYIIRYGLGHSIGQIFQ